MTKVFIDEGQWQNNEGRNDEGDLCFWNTGSQCITGNWSSDSAEI